LISFGWFGSSSQQASCAILASGIVVSPRIRFPIYITDARHFLDEKSAIASRRGPGKAMADFHASVIGYATDFDSTGVIALQVQATPN